MTIEGEPLDLLDWRRKVFELYREIRGSHDPQEAWELWRIVREDLLKDHPQSPIPEEGRGEFEGPWYFDYDPSARTVAHVRPMERETVDVVGSDGSEYEMTRFGQAVFPWGDESYALELYWIDVYGGGVFLSFRDETSGSETYGAGRYLLDTIKGADLGSVPTERSPFPLLILDFNFAFNPSCSYDPRWACPLAPPENRLPFPVRAGERSGPG